LFQRVRTLAIVVLVMVARHIHAFPFPDDLHTIV
jgi:hypothetical protein